MSPILTVTRAGLLLALCSTCACYTHVARQTSDDKWKWNLSRAGFVQELVFPEATPRTPQFDDYTTGSYHVDKLDLVEGVRSLRSSRPDVVGVVIWGPTGPLWSFDTFLFIREDERIRMNRIVFPHARITFKGTALMSGNQYGLLLEGIANNSALVSGPPTFDTISREPAPNLSLDWHYAVLVADWSQGPERLWHSRGNLEVNPEPSIQPFLDQIEQVTDAMTVTYASDLPDGETVYNEIPER